MEINTRGKELCVKLVIYGKSKFCKVGGIILRRGVGNKEANIN